MRLDRALIWFHVTSNLFWIGAIIAAALVILASSGTPKVRGELARRIYMMVAVPAFIGSMVGGFGRLMMDTKLYLVDHHWMHGKLLFALIAIGLHHAVGARARKLANGDTEEVGPTKFMAIGFAVAAAVAAFFVIFQFPD